MGQYVPTDQHREAMADGLLELRERTPGRTYCLEMRRTVMAWLILDAQMGKRKVEELEYLADGLAASPSTEDTPGLRLMRIAAEGGVVKETRMTDQPKPQARRIEQEPRVEDKGTHQVVHGTPPPPPSRGVGPGVHELAALRSGSYLKIPPRPNGEPLLKIAAMKQRVTQAKKLDGCSPALMCWIQEDNTIIVRP